MNRSSYEKAAVSVITSCMQCYEGVSTGGTFCTYVQYINDLGVGGCGRTQGLCGRVCVRALQMGEATVVKCLLEYSMQCHCN